MNRGVAPRLHGASISAPLEAYAESDSPAPASVLPRRGQQKAASRGISAWISALRVVFGIAVVIGVAVAVAWSAHRYALTSPRFSVRNIEVRGGERVGAQQVKEQGGVAVGANLFAMDTAQVERGMLDNPWVSSIKVTRKLPNTLEVTLTERQARAIAVLSGKLYLVSPSGEPFKPLAPKDPIDLPVITGLDPTELVRDRQSELARLKHGLEVLRQYERLGMSRSYAAQEVHLAPGGSVTLSVGKAGIMLNLGVGQLRQRLLMAERVVLEMRRGGRVPGIVFADNLAHPERVVVRMR